GRLNCLSSVSLAQRTERAGPGPPASLTKVRSKVDAGSTSVRARQIWRMVITGSAKGASHTLTAGERLGRRKQPRRGRRRDTPRRPPPCPSPLASSALLLARPLTEEFGQRTQQRAAENDEC